jgi:hypothetical protein
MHSTIKKVHQIIVYLVMHDSIFSQYKIYLDFQSVAKPFYYIQELRFSYCSRFLLLMRGCVVGKFTMMMIMLQHHVRLTTSGVNFTWDSQQLKKMLLNPEKIFRGACSRTIR